MKTSKNDFNKVVADKVIKLMETAGSDWVKSWSVPQNMQPTSMSTNKPYNGINWLVLSLERAAKGYSTGEWATFNQWFVLGGGIKNQKGVTTQKSKYSVEAGSKATRICLFTTASKENKETGEKEGYTIFKTFNVFNADQIKGYAPKIETPQIVDQPSTIFDKVAFDVKATIKNDDLASAYFVPSKDYINLPLATQFDTLEAYAATGFHELTHWTGHKNRLNRDLKNSFGSKDYAKEELIAELGAAMLCGSYGVSAEPREDHAKYLNSWIARLKEEPKLIADAAAAANKACFYLTEASKALDLAA